MSRTLIASVTVTICLVAAMVLGSAHGAEGWQRLGTRTVEFGGDTDTIVVGRNEGAFRAIMFEVDGGDIELRNVNVVFGNGRPFSPPTKFVFSENERSRVIDLPGVARFIRSVTFNYRSLRTGKGRATVTLYGR
jgi:hypothetical protein